MLVSPVAGEVVRRLHQECQEQLPADVIGITCESQTRPEEAAVDGGTAPGGGEAWEEILQQ